MEFQKADNPENQELLSLLLLPQDLTIGESIGILRQLHLRKREANEKFVSYFFGSIPLLPLFLCVSKVLIVPDHAS